MSQARFKRNVTIHECKCIQRAISESKATLMFFDWLQIPILFRLIIILWEYGRLNGLSIGLFCGCCSFRKISLCVEINGFLLIQVRMEAPILD